MSDGTTNDAVFNIVANFYVTEWIELTGSIDFRYYVSTKCLTNLNKT